MKLHFQTEKREIKTDQRMIIFSFQDEIFRATQRFVILKYLSVKMARCTAGSYFEDSVMTVHYLPIINTTVTATNDVNGNIENSEETAGSQVVLPEGRNSKEEDDDVDYYAYERKRKQHRQGVDRSSGVYDTSFIALLFLNKFYLLK